MRSIELNPNGDTDISALVGKTIRLIRIDLETKGGTPEFGSLASCTVQFTPDFRIDFITELENTSIKRHILFPDKKNAFTVTVKNCKLLDIRGNLKDDNTIRLWYDPLS